MLVSKDFDLILKHLLHEDTPLETKEQKDFVIAFKLYCSTVKDILHDSGKNFISAVTDIVDGSMVKMHWSRLIIPAYGWQLKATEGYTSATLVPASNPEKNPSIIKDARIRTLREINQLGEEKAGDIMGDAYVQAIKKAI